MVVKGLSTFAAESEGHIYVQPYVMFQYPRFFLLLRKSANTTFPHRFHLPIVKSILYFSAYFILTNTKIRNIMAEKTRYSDEELKEFEQLINEKLAKAKSELQSLRESLTRDHGDDTGATGSSVKTLEDGADTAEKEQLSQLAGRQQKFINNLENALIRIKNGTYGICVDTGKLISKDRLRAVPHTMHSIEAKLKK